MRASVLAREGTLGKSDFFLLSRHGGKKKEKARTATLLSYIVRCGAGGKGKKKKRGRQRRFFRVGRHRRCPPRGRGGGGQKKKKKGEGENVNRDGNTVLRFEIHWDYREGRGGGRNERKMGPDPFQRANGTAGQRRDEKKERGGAV